MILQILCITNSVNNSHLIYARFISDFLLKSMCNVCANLFMCPFLGCCYGNTTVDFGAVIADYPEKCLKLTCQMQNITEAPYIAGAIVEDSVDNCSCTYQIRKI